MTLSDARKLNEAYDELKKAEDHLRAVLKRVRSATDKAELERCLQHIDDAQSVLA